MEANEWEHAFQVDLSSWSFTDETPFGDELAVSVLTDVVMLRNGLCVSDAAWLTMQEVLELFPDVVGADAEQDADRETVAENMPVPCWADLPWLLEHLAGGFGDESKA